MLLYRRLRGATFVASLVVVAGLVGGGIRAARGAPCDDEGAGVRIWHAPETPVVGQPLWIIAVGALPGAASLQQVDAGEKKGEALAGTRRFGPPASLTALVAEPRAGKHRLELRQGGEKAGKLLACHEVTVVKRAADRPRRAVESVYWKSTRAWDKATEGFYAAWVEALFDAPTSESLSFRPLTPAMRDPKRNFLADYLGLGEDDAKNKEALAAEPDCADLPYYLRAYFAWKLGLPMGFRDCDRGSGTAAPKCGELTTNESPVMAPEPAGGAKGKAGKPPKPPKTTLAVMKRFLRKLGNTVHSGTARTALGDEVSDLYPVALDRQALRPGTVYADPYGHVLVLAKWVPAADGAGGLLLAVDGQPDGSIARKRFWEGTFLFAAGEKSAGPGWKAFRPLVLAGGDAGADAAPPTPATNALLAKGAPPLSREQESVSVDEFYARMAKLINPAGLPPKLAYEETLAALVEQLETRVGSVDNGEKYAVESKGALVEMPEGAKIFETVGAWEDYATPSRDMRLIIAMNVLGKLPERVEKHPELFVLGGRKPAEARKEMEALHERLTRERSIEYKRSDGSPQRLTVAELLARRAGFELAYNPNDCVEWRWGAPAGSPEMATCKRRAPPDQQARMEQYRAWFREARRPPR